MRLKIYNQLFWGVCTLLILFCPAHADRRSYVWTYEYLTVERGHAEVESYTTFSSPNINHLEGTTTTEHQVELEIGMTDRFDFAIYQIFSQAPESPMQYNGYKLRSRYRLGEKGQYLLDPLLYFEYKGKSDFSEHELEGKLILAKDMGKFNVALNPIFEFAREAEEKEWEFEPAYAAGIRYHVRRLLNIGLEAKGSGDGHYLGPVIAHGRHNLWMALGSAFKISDIEDGKSEFQIRLLLGIGLSNGD